MDPDRDPEALRRHYDVERRLAARLREAPPEERRRLYSEVYDELFRSVPDHPQHQSHADPALRQWKVDKSVATLRAFLAPGATYVELGSGDGTVANAAAEWAGRVYAVEVSEEIARDSDRPANVELVLSDGTSVPVEPGAATLAFSDQLMEHLHPDDARAQLANVAAALAPGGRYVCITPNALSGPHDISRLFGADVPDGFHLREYTNAELAGLMRSAGFARVRGFVTVGGRTIVYPLAVPIAVEHLLTRLGRRGRRLARTAPGRRLLGNRVIATKPGRFVQERTGRGPWGRAA